jgi:hypothetical protein
MSTQCVLEAESYRVVFHFKNAATDGNYLDTLIELSLHPELGTLSVKSVPTFLSVSDLRRLIAYLEEHIAGLEEDAGKESGTFVPLELGFQAQALAGEVESESEGEFSLLFLVNVGQREDCSPAYVGAESVVNVAKIKDFTSALDEVMAELVTSR